MVFSLSHFFVVVVVSREVVVERRQFYQQNLETMHIIRDLPKFLYKNI